jgi:hypothetical protein
MLINSERVFVALGIQHAMRMRHCHLWPARLSNIFQLYFKRHNFWKICYWKLYVY